MSLFILQTVQKFGEAAGDTLSHPYIWFFFFIGLFVIDGST